MGLTTRPPRGTIGGVSTLAELIDSSSNLVAFTGAGISTDSGLPDFRGPQGLWTTDPSAAASFSLWSFKANQRVREAYWSSRLAVIDAEPNDGHRALASLYEAGKLTAVITQNVDGLHQAAGVPSEAVHELHGSLSHVECWGCGRRLSMELFMAVANEAPWTPATYRCTCRKLFKPGVVLFGEKLDTDVFDAAYEAALGADLLLVLGSSLSVFPAAGIVGAAAHAGGRVVIVNYEPTDYDDDAMLVLRHGVSEALRPFLAP